MRLSNGSYLSRPVSPRSIKNSLEMTSTVQTNMFCFTWHKVFSMLNKFWDVLKTQKPKTNHAFLDTMAGKSAISGSTGKHCRQSERNNQKKIVELHDFFLFVFGTGTMLTAQLSTLFTPDSKEESIWGDGWRARKQDTYCTTSVAAPLGNPNWCTNQPSPTTTNHQPAAPPPAAGYASAPLTLELLNPCSATHTSWPKS